MTIRTNTGGPAVLAGPWPDPVVPDISLPELLLVTAAEQAERPAVIDASSGRTLHYGELAEGVRRVASGLAALGLRPGNVFAIMAPNSPEWLLARSPPAGWSPGSIRCAPRGRSRRNWPTPKPALS